MALTAYCKKCARDVAPGEICPRCGGKLGRAASRVAWCVDHSPVRDWMCWNAAMRVMLPAATLVLALILLLEGIAAGPEGIESLLRGGLLITILGLVLAASAVLLLALILQGDDVLDCVADSRGVHVQQYLPDPTPLKLLARLRSPKLMDQMGPEDTMLPLSQRELAWKDVARVQLWPEKNLVLCYAPAWWLRVALPCSPFHYSDVLDYISDRIGSRRNVVLPDELRVEKPASRSARASRPARQTAPQPSVPSSDDLALLSDVFSEIRAMNDQDVAPPQD